MPAPSLTDLPLPPLGKTGWPWTEETPRGPDLLTDDRLSGRRITIVTPSFNQGQFLEETIRSVLLQGYPDLEYIIIDGGSADESVSIIRKYEKWLAHWVSEKDSGQADAINKGFSHASGEICAYLNSDDVFRPNALRNVVSFFDKYSDVAVVYGDCQIIDESSGLNDLWIAPEFDLRELLFRCYIAQPATFWRKSAASVVGDFNVGMHYAFDYDMWLRLAAVGQKLSHAPIVLAQHRKAVGTKTVSTPEAFTAEIVSALERFFGSPSLPVALKSCESDAYAIAFLKHSLLSLRLHSPEEGRQALELAFRHSPDLVARQRERVIQALVDNADPSSPPDAAREYLELVFSHLPPNAVALQQIRANVWRRVEILHSARSKDRGALRRARRLVPATLIHDSAWMRNHAARGEILKVLIGQPAMQRLAGFKDLLRAARSAFPIARKDYG
jgi:glycosyltransferase involved in cell wall biosynthesis